MIRLRPSGVDEILIKRVRDWYEPGPGVFIASMTGASFSPAMLFTGSTNGGWYDPSDTTTLFQDAAGTTPVTAVEQPVGLTLDKSKGLVLGSELVANGNFSSGSNWTRIGTGGTVVISGGVASVTNVAGSFEVIGYSQSIPVGPGKTYFVTAAYTKSSVSGFARVSFGPTVVFNGTATSGVISGYVTASASTFTLQAFNPGNGSEAITVTFDNISVRELPGNHAFNLSGNSANFPVLSARYNLYASTETLATQNVTTVTTSYKLTFTGSGSITLTGTATGVYTAGSYTISCTAGTLTSTVLGTVAQADLRAANDALNQPAYQRVNTSSDYDTAGFKQGEVFDGINDYLTASAGGGSTTSFFWCSAIRVGKVGAVQTLFSDAGTNTGYRVRINASNQLELSAGNGTAYTTVSTTATLSIGQRSVLTAWHDGTNLNVQINNGTVHQVAFSTATAGTAQFTIGKDNNAASNFFAGWLYEKVYTKDSVPSSAQIADTKAYVANIAGITL